ncbi:hypothetical protein KGO5_03066 [Sinorhizobium sp. KGO-5]|nr:hypothetical protein KGO5_03066 [Sinorhizobium sp. KGO-5]
MDNQNNTNSTLLKMAKLACAVMKDKDSPFHLRREASEALIEFDVCDLIFTKEAKATISALNGLMKLSATETPKPTAEELFDKLAKTIDEIVALANTSGYSETVHSHIKAFVDRQHDEAKHARFVRRLNRK